jgi:hypothetical protein
MLSIFKYSVGERKARINRAQRKKVVSGMKLILGSNLNFLA